MTTTATLKCTHPAKRQAAYTLIELMIVLMIIGVLAAIAMPAYNKVYVKRAKFSEVVTAAASIKLSIDVCYQLTLSLESCDNDPTSDPVGRISDADLNGAKIGQYVSDVTVQNNTGRITATGTNEVYSASLVLTPTETIDTNGEKSGSLQWVTTGTCTGLYLC